MIKKLLIGGLVASFSLSAFIALPTHKSSALSGSEFRAGRIIDDTVFTNKNAMSPSQIQAFLNAKVPVCDRNRPSSNPSYQPPYTCLKEYQENPNTGENNYGRFNSDGSPYQVPGGKSAAQIIWDAGQAYNINPQVLLVVLQKEQSLITDDWPWAIQYWRAMGNRCPDGPGGAQCNPNFAGFYKQVDGGTWQLRHDFDGIGTPGFSSAYKQGWNNILYQDPNTNPNCGTKSVFIENQATAVLYKYTPYTPNQAALNNLYGMGDSCSAYGNRNFWRLFNDWFGISITSARVIVMPVDPTTDSTGKAAKVKIKLNQPISSPLSIPLSLTGSTGVFATPSTITISPENWNNPEKNTIVVRGQNVSGQEGTIHYMLQTGSPSTNDPNFKLLTADYIDDVLLTHLDNTDSGVSRLFNSSTGKHIYSSDHSEIADLTADGYRTEETAFYSCRSGEIPIYRFESSDGSTKMLYQEGLLVSEAILAGYQYSHPVLASSRGGSVPVYMLISSTGDTFYTTNTAEKDIAVASYGYVDKGIGFYACGKDQEPIYRLYSSATGDHFLTLSAVERDAAGANGYAHEGVGLYTCGTANINPVFRFYSAAQHEHFYTMNENEKSYAQSIGYTYEGIGFQVCNETSGLKVQRLVSPAKTRHLFTPSAEEAGILKSNGYSEETPLFFSAP